MTWRITHVDHLRRRRQLEIEAVRRSDAERQAVQLLGAAFYMATIAIRHLGGVRP